MCGGVAVKEKLNLLLFGNGVIYDNRVAKG